MARPTRFWHGELHRSTEGQGKQKRTGGYPFSNSSVSPRHAGTDTTACMPTGKPHQMLDWLRAIALPTTITPYLARVSATFVRRQSVMNDKSPPCLVRTCAEPEPVSLFQVHCQKHRHVCWPDLLCGRSRGACIFLRLLLRLFHFQGRCSCPLGSQESIAICSFMLD